VSKKKNLRLGIILLYCSHQTDMSKSNKYIPHSQITLVPGLAKAILQKKKVKEFEFYGHLKSLQISGCIKEYDINIDGSFDTNLSVKTIKRRFQALQDLGWIDIKKGNIYVRSLKKVCESVGCFYNEERPRKKNFTSNRDYTIKQLLCAESLREHINSQKHQFLKKSSKQMVKTFLQDGAGSTKFWLLSCKEDLETHSRFLRAMDVTASREKCAEIWKCSEMEASRIINALSKHNILLDRRRAGKIDNGNEAKACMLRKAYNDPTIFHKNGKIFKKLNNKISFLKRDEDYNLVEDCIFSEGYEDEPNTKFRLEMMYQAFLSKFSLGMRF